MVDLTDKQKEILKKAGEIKIDKSGDIKPSSAKNLTRAAMQGLSFGFADEIEALISSVASDKTYAEEVSKIRKSIEEFRQESPATAYGAEIGASMLVPFGAARTVSRFAPQLASKVAAAPAAAARAVSGAIPSAAGRAATALVPAGVKAPAATAAQTFASRAAPIAKPAAGAALGGAAYGAGVAEGGLPERVEGAVTGGAVGGLLGGAVGAALPRASEAAQALLKEGVPLTAGQAMGGLPRLAEGVLGAVPVAREFVEAAKDRATRGFTSATMNRALSPLGEKGKLPKDLAGVEAFDEAMELISKEYDRIIPKLNVGSAEDMSSAIQRGIADAVEEQPTLRGKDLKDFNNLIGNIFSKLPKSGKVDGKILKQIESRLTSSAKTEINKGRPDIAFALNDVKATFRSELARQDKTGSKALQAVNTAYKNILPIERSVNKALAEGGAFTPKQLMASMRQQAPRQTARGRATDQEFAAAAQEVMGRGRQSGALVAPLTGLTVAQQAMQGRLNPALALLGTAAGVAPLYSRVGVPVTRGLLSGAGELGVRSTPAIAGGTTGLLMQD